MTWFPIGPDFVKNPRVNNYTRISKRNMWGMQSRLNCISFEAGAVAGEPENVYVVATDTSGQCAAFRKGRTGIRWESITDSLRSVNSNVDPQWIAVNPNNPSYIYMGSRDDRGIYVSPNRGEAGSWSPKAAIPGRVRKIIVDPRPAMDINHTILYAATDQGVFKSSDNGSGWLSILAGNEQNMESHSDIGQTRPGSPQEGKQSRV
jgi:hypothetical protein